MRARGRRIQEGFSRSADLRPPIGPKRVTAPAFPPTSSSSSSEPIPPTTTTSALPPPAAAAAHPGLCFSFFEKTTKRKNIKL